MLVFLWTIYTLVSGSVATILSPAHLRLTQALSVTFLASPYPCSHLLVQSFSIATVYISCVLWLVVSKNLCVSSNIDFAPKLLFPQAVVLVLTVLFSLSLWDGPHPEVCSWSCPRLGILGQGPASWARQTDKFQKRNDNIEKEAVQPWDSNKSYYWIIHTSELLRSLIGRSKTKTGISRVRREIGKIWGRCWSWV